MSKRTEPAVVEVFSALGDETRLALIVKLRTGFLSATTLSDGAPVTRQAILKHLNVLESAGLVSHEKRGREVLYALEPRRLQDATAFLERISAGWDRAIARLRVMVEEPPKSVPRKSARPKH
jgi:DNA-binding transcriptional ArsR family regulator